MILGEQNNYGLEGLLAKDRRRRSEAAQAAACGELAALLLPLSLAIARLAARRAVAGEAAQ